MIRRPPRSTRVRSSAASDVYKRQGKKSTLNATECQFLGHKVDSTGVQHLETRVQGLLDLQPPYDVKTLRQFLGLLNYFGEHLGADLAEVMRPLHMLTTSRTPSRPGVYDVPRWIPRARVRGAWVPSPLSAQRFRSSAYGGTPAGGRIKGCGSMSE